MESFRSLLQNVCIAHGTNYDHINMNVPVLHVGTTLKKLKNNFKVQQKNALYRAIEKC